MPVCVCVSSPSRSGSVAWRMNTQAPELQEEGAEATLSWRLKGSFESGFALGAEAAGHSSAPAVPHPEAGLALFFVAEDVVFLQAKVLVANDKTAGFHAALVSFLGRKTQMFPVRLWPFVQMGDLEDVPCTALFNSLKNHGEEGPGPHFDKTPWPQGLQGGFTLSPFLQTKPSEGHDGLGQQSANSSFHPPGSGSGNSHADTARVRAVHSGRSEQSLQGLHTHGYTLAWHPVMQRDAT